MDVAIPNNIIIENCLIFLYCRQALTEVSVLSDVIQIAQHQHKYVALDPVMASPSGSASPAYQYLVKKKSLSLAAEILQKGTRSLSLSSTDKEKEFHKTLLSLRQRWRLKRAGSGAIVGDLSYHSCNHSPSPPPTKKNLLLRYVLMV